MHRQVRLAVLALVLMTSSMTCVTGYARLHPRYIRPDDSRIIDHQIGLKDPGARPSARLILIILKQKCQRLIDQGVTELPSFCWQVLGNGRPSITTLNRAYDTYAGSVPSDQILQSINEARQENTANMASRLFQNASPRARS